MNTTQTTKFLKKYKKNQLCKFQKCEISEYTIYCASILQRNEFLLYCANQNIIKFPQIALYVNLIFHNINMIDVCIKSGCMIDNNCMTLACSLCDAWIFNWCIEYNLMPSDDDVSILLDFDMFMMRRKNMIKSYFNCSLAEFNESDEHPYTFMSDLINNEYHDFSHFIEHISKLFHIMNYVDYFYVTNYSESASKDCNETLKNMFWIRHKYYEFEKNNDDGMYKHDPRNILLRYDFVEDLVEDDIQNYLSMEIKKCIHILIRLGFVFSDENDTLINIIID
jgi:hypothetical protein